MCDLTPNFISTAYSHEYNFFPTILTTGKPNFILFPNLDNITCRTQWENQMIKAWFVDPQQGWAHGLMKVTKCFFSRNDAFRLISRLISTAYLEVVTEILRSQGLKNKASITILGNKTHLHCLLIIIIYKSSITTPGNIIMYTNINVIFFIINHLHYPLNIFLHVFSL